MMDLFPGILLIKWIQVSQRMKYMGALLCNPTPQPFKTKGTILLADGCAVDRYFSDVNHLCKLLSPKENHFL